MNPFFQQFIEDISPCTGFLQLCFLLFYCWFCFHFSRWIFVRSHFRNGFDLFLFERRYLRFLLNFRYFWLIFWNISGRGLDLSDRWTFNYRWFGKFPLNFIGPWYYSSPLNRLLSFNRLRENRLWFFWVDVGLFGTFQASFDCPLEFIGWDNGGSRCAFLMGLNRRISFALIAHKKCLDYSIKSK